jgi:Response regulator containing a CheY-like receiver domain and an HD-GYP domain
METIDEKKATILIVDDTPDSIAVLSSILKAHYRVKVSTSGEKALGIAAGNPPPDLILLDVMMPGMDGYETCRRLKANPATADIPVIFLTAKNGEADEEQGLALGAADYITKPPSPPIVLARIGTHLHLKSVRDFLRDKNEYLEAEVSRRTADIGRIQDATMMVIGSLAETRDNETANHIRRIQLYVRVLAEKLAEHPRFSDAFMAETIERFAKSAPLHDIGKVGIPDGILTKPTALDPEEFELMKTHTTIGRDAISRAEKLLGAPSSFLSAARDMAGSHHERWDGSGYPQGLCGEAIPLEGRIMAICDVYDTLRNGRIYKPPYTHERAVEDIREGAGSQFDPDIALAFLEVSDRFREIAEKYNDEERSDQ